MRSICFCLIIALITSGCSRVGVSNSNEAYLGRKIVSADIPIVRYSSRVVDSSAKNYTISLEREVVDQETVDQYKVSETVRYSTQGFASNFLCESTDSGWIILSPVLFAAGLYMDILGLGILYAELDCYRDSVSSDYRNRQPYYEGKRTEPVAGRNIHVAINDFNGHSRDYVTDANGSIKIDLLSILPDEPTRAVISMSFTEAGQVQTLNQALDYSFVADAIHNSPKRRYAYGPPNLTATVRFSEPSGNNLLDAEESAKVLVTVTNTGRGDAFGVTAELGVDKAVRGLNFDARQTIGTIPAGQSLSREIPLFAAKEIPAADLRFTINVREAGGFDAEPLQLAFRSKAFEPPKLIVADLGIEDQSGNAKIEPQEIVEVTARVQNAGYGIARRVVVDVVPGENVLFTADSLRRFELGALPTGKYEDIKFSFYTNRRIANGEAIPIRLLLSEERTEYNVTKPLELVMNAPQKRTQEIVVKGEEAPRSEIEVAGGLSVDIHQNIPLGMKGGRDDIAVVIGNRNYQRGTPPVDFAQSDARIMKEYLIQTLGYEEGNIFYEEDAGLATFNALFGNESDHRGKLFNNIREGKSRVFVYYVGHGVPDPATHEAFFLPVDADTQSLRTSAYRLQTFYDNLAKLPAREITVVLDACFSGNSVKGELIKGRSGIGMVRKAQQPTIATVFTSAGDDQYSVWYTEKKHSLFTYYFLKGLQGMADSNRDRQITVAELENYLKEEVPFMARKLMGTPQQPTVAGRLDQVVAVLK